MSEKKRWVLVVDGGTHDWIKETASELNTSGQSLFTEMLRQFKGQDLSKFKEHIHAAQVQEQLDRIASKKQALEEEEKAIRNGTGKAYKPRRSKVTA